MPTEARPGLMVKMCCSAACCRNGQNVLVGLVDLTFSDSHIVVVGSVYAIV